MAVPERARADMLDAAAGIPVTTERIDEPRDVRRIRLRVEGADLSSGEVQGAGQSVHGEVIEIQDARNLRAGLSDPEAQRYLAAEPLIESDAPEIQAEASLAVRGVTGNRDRAERLTRYVNSILERKPAVSLPSALEALRTRIGDGNAHTALYVAMARALEIPARIAAGLVSVRGAFYYHAWPEVYLDEGRDRGLWLPVDPALNEFPADSTHLPAEMCDRISIIMNGRIIARGTVGELQALTGSVDDPLTSVFLKLTGGGALQEIDEIV